MYDYTLVKVYDYTLYMDTSLREITHLGVLIVLLSGLFSKDRQKRILLSKSSDRNICLICQKGSTQKKEFAILGADSFLKE